MTAPPASRRRRLLRALLPLALCALPTLGGCAYLGYAAYVASGSATVAASYKGLTGQNAAIMVWADPVGIRNDFENLQSDVALQMQAIFNGMSTGKDPSKDLAGTKFLDPRAVLRYQEDHPELDGHMLAVAPRLGVSRVIYIEISTFETHSAMSIDLYRGRAMASLKVLEIKDGVAKVAFAENDISVIYPPRSNEGVPATDTTTADKIYSGTVTELAKQVSLRFYEHAKADDDEIQ